MATEIADRYRLVEPLGRGGMGTVWRAHDQKLGRHVALKEVQFPGYLPDQERRSLRERVLQEARAAARLNHPGAVTVFDVFEEDDKTFIAMEMVEWPSMADLVQERGPLPEAVVAQIGRGLVETLSEAHRNGIIHRDVKPANVMVSPDGRVKLTDFGIASVSGGPDLTATGAIVGSPSYMSPERARGAEATPASDLWALGATLYFGVAGRAPFERGEVLPTLNAILTEEPPPLEGPLAGVIMKLLSKDAGARPEAGELSPMLEEAAATAGVAPVSDTMPIEVASPAGTDEPPRTLSDPDADPDAGPDPDPDPTAPAAQSPEIHETEPAPPVTSPSPATSQVMSGRKNSRPWVLALIALIVVGIAAIALSSLPEPGSQRADDGETAPEEPGGQRAAPRTGGSSEEPDTTGRPAQAGAPRGWRSFTIAETGHQISYPPSWRLVRNPIGDGSSARFQGPQGKYLLLDWTDEPGPDAAAAWEAQAASFAGRHQDYREIRIEPTTFRDFDTAAIWEFTYSEGGAALHAIDLGFADERWGFALNFQTREADWQESLKTFEEFKSSFRPA